MTSGEKTNDKFAEAFKVAVSLNFQLFFSNFEGLCSFSVNYGYTGEEVR